jgi:hypothetical protein
MAIFDNVQDHRDDADYQAYLSQRGEAVDAPVSNGDPNLKSARAGEKHADPVAPQWGEGVITGDPADHYVHLANGAVIPGSSGGTHYHDPEMGLVPIVSTFPAGKTLK